MLPTVPGLEIRTEPGSRNPTMNVLKSVPAGGTWNMGPGIYEPSASKKPDGGPALIVKLMSLEYRERSHLQNEGSRVL